MANWNPFGSMRFGSMMGSPKPYIDESGAIGQKRFTTGTMPSWEERYRPHQAQAQPNPWEQEEDNDPRNEANKYYDELERVRGAKGPALTAYQQALKEQPTWEQNKPTWKRRLAGALIGGSVAMDDRTSAGEAAALGGSVVTSKYRQAQQEYANRMKGLGASAKLEQDDIESQLAALKEARALGLKYDEFKLKRLENEQLQNFRRGQLDNQGRVAATGERNARTNEYDANTRRWTAEQTDERGDRTLDLTETRDYNNERNIDSQISNRDEVNRIARERIQADLQREQMRSGRRTPASPSAQSDAIEGGLRQLMTDPQFKDYVELDAKGFPQLKPDDGSDEWQMAKRRLVEIAHRQLQTGLPFGDSNVDDPDPDVEIEGIHGGGGAGW